MTPATMTVTTIVAGEVMTTMKMTTIAADEAVQMTIQSRTIARNRGLKAVPKAVRETMTGKAGSASVPGTATGIVTAIATVTGTGTGIGTVIAATATDLK